MPTQKLGESLWVNSTVDLPEWFNLENYSDLYFKGTRWWYDQLTARCCIWNESRYHKENSTDRVFDPDYQQWYEQITNYTFVDTGANQVESYIVRPITMNDAAAAVYLCETKGVEGRSPVDSIFESIEPKLHISIDLGVTDRALIRDFKKLIAKARCELNMPEPSAFVSPRKIEKFSEYRVLPLLDLMNWELKEGFRIKRSVLAAAVFPNGEKGERELTETVIPFARQCIGVAFLEELFSYES